MPFFKNSKKRAILAIATTKIANRKSNGTLFYLKIKDCIEFLKKYGILYFFLNRKGNRLE